MAISFYEDNVSAKLKNRLALKSFIKQVVLEKRPEVKKIDISYIFCDDASLLQINQDFLQHDTYTDIITFDLSETKQQLQSEIYISVSRISENAIHFATSYNRELHRVIFHGILHLCGLKDKSKSDALLMRKEEEICLNRYLVNKA
jgi:probable rRNA maturation factor